MSNKPHKLDPEQELTSWFEEARLTLSNEIRVERRVPKDKAAKTSATLGLIGKSVICTITVFSGGYINVNEEVYGNVEYIIHRDGEKQGRCKDTIIKDAAHLRAVLDECFNDYLSSISGR